MSEVMDLPAEDAAKVAGRVFVVTGAGSGIGLACAGLLIELGATVVGVDLRAPDPLASGLPGQGGGWSFVACDVTDREAMQKIATDVVARHGRIDGWVNSAGVMMTCSVAELSEAELDRVLSINLKGTLWGCQAAVAVMQAQGSGSIVNLSSAAADLPKAGNAAYAMSKGAVVQLTRILSLEMADKGVRVNAIAPGLIVTGITARHFTRPDGSVDPEKRAATIERFAAAAPMGRVGTAREIALAAHYLLSDASAFMTGQVLRLNGGTSLG